jgi:predicted nucleic acid-binding protein
MAAMLLLDNSVWGRRHQGAVRERIATAMERREVGVCVPFLLEAGFSARSASHHAEIARRFALLPHAPMTQDVGRLALEAQADLTRIGHHRLAPVDILIAACAHESGAGVLHYDRDYDVLREHTRLRFRSEWLAPAGSLD